MSILTGTNGSDTMYGDASSDQIYGGNGNDSVIGGTGEDSLYGGNGRDTLFGGEGDDVSYGGNGNDVVIGDGVLSEGWVAGQIVSAYMSPVASPIESFFEVIGTATSATQDGGFVQVWHSREYADIQLQFSDANGNPIGPVISLGPGYEPALTVLSDSSTVIVWQYQGNTYCQVVDEFGQLSGELTQVNSGEFGASSWQSVTALETGGFVVAFGSDVPGDGDNWGVISQFYDADGAPIGSNVVVNTYIDGRQVYPSVQQVGNGNVVFAWASLDQDGDGYGIYTQHYDELGQKVGVESLVNSSISGDQTFPSVCALEDGSYIVVWSSTGSVPGTFDILGQHFEADGTAIGDESVLAGANIGTLEVVAADALTGGGFVLAWETDSIGSGSDVVACTYSDGMEATSNLIEVTGAIAGNQVKPTVEGLASGSFVVTWSTTNSGEGLDGVYNRVFESSGGDDILYGGNGTDTLVGGAGDDFLYGGSGSDTFQFDGQFGNDLIFDFEVGTDILDVSSLGIASLDEVMSSSYQSGSDAHIVTSGGKIVLLGVLLSDLTGDDFDL